MIRRPIDKIIIHCSATPNGRWVADVDVDKWHRERGFKRTGPKALIFNPGLTSIGYHYLIGTNGAVFTGRHLEEIGAHAVNANQRSIGICMAGTDAFSKDQWDSLRKMFMALPYALFDERLDTGFSSAVAKLQQRGVKILGHRDLPDVHKTCPGFDVSAWLANGGEPLKDHLYKGKIE